ncbi:hypothetical protein ACR9E3_24815 [Actinomycetospora sp. C-140]
MTHRGVPVLAGSVLAGLLVLGGCAGAPGESPQPAAAPAASAPTGGSQTPCTTRLRPGGGGGSTMALTPEVRAEIERLRQQPPGQAAASPDPALASRLAEVSRRVESAGRPCSDR